MAHCSSHISDNVVAVLTYARVRIIKFAFHITHIFQVLDVVLVGALKNPANGLKMFDQEQSAAACLLKVYHDFKQTMIYVNISKTFAVIRFTHDIEQSP
jgi:heptaprenylglyceryl phosphate synthase